MANAASKPDHIVILIHGIRTHALWYERAKALLGSNPRIRVEPIRYGRFGLIPFLLPGPWRKRPIEIVKRKVSPIVVDANRNNQIITVIAHSNGAQIVSRILQEDDHFSIDNLIMCGSIIDVDYNWNLVKHKVRNIIVNEYGTHDIWPALAHSCTWGYGYTGSVGFGSPIIDRMHKAKHSSYLNKDFMYKYWKPLITNNTFVPSKYVSNHPLWFSIFEFPWKWVILIAITLGIWAIVAWFLSTPPAVNGEVPSPPVIQNGSSGGLPTVPDTVRAPPPPPPSPYAVIQAAFLSNEWTDFTIYQGESRNAFTNEALEIVGANEAGSPPTRLRFTIKNQTPEDRTITAFRFQLRQSFSAQGDGTVTTQPPPMTPVPAGSLRLSRLLLIDCRRPASIPSVTAVLPAPVKIRARENNFFEINIDSSLDRNMSVVLYGGNKTNDEIDYKQRCMDEQGEHGRRSSNSVHSMFEDYQNSVIEIYIRDDSGTWVPLGLMNLRLPF